MAFNKTLAERIRERLDRRKNVEEKKMFGGVGFLLNGNIRQCGDLLYVESREADHTRT